MYEVEVKVPAEIGRVRDRLRELDAEPLGSVTQVDTYFDAPHRDFARTDEALRIRKEAADGGPETTILTYKGPLVDDASKSRTEVETVVEDPDGMTAILEALGFDPAATVRKDRRRFEYDSYTVCLDQVEGLGEFVEVERQAEAVAPAREGAFDVLAALDLDPDDGIRTSYLGLLLAAEEEG